ncbi:MAG: PRK06851 family protein [Sarcina sp.]
MGKFIHYFGGGNTARGFVSFYESIFYDTKEAYVLKGGSNTYKTKILEKLSLQYANLYDVEVINSGIDNTEIEGIKVPDLEIAIVNGNLIHDNNITFNKAVKIEIDLSDATNIVQINSKQDELKGFKEKVFEYMNLSYKSFEKSLKIHDDLEGYYYKYMDFDKANKLAKNLSDRLVYRKNNSTGVVYHRYLGAASPIGAIDFVPSITQGIKRYFLKGRAGTGKSTLLKTIAKNAQEAGFKVEIYHCGFDPKSLDMVVVRELNFAIFDSTAPHEYFPSREDDEVIDTYKEFCTDDVDKIFEKEIKSVEGDYIKYKAEAITYLKEAQNYKIEYDKIYDNALDEDKANTIVTSKLLII